MQPESRPANDEFGSPVLSLELSRAGDNIFVVIAETQSHVLQVPGDEKTGGVIDGTVLRGPGNRRFLGRILNVLDTVVEADPDILDVKVESEFGTGLQAPHAVLVVPKIFIVADANGKVEQVVVGQRVAGVESQQQIGRAHV